MVADVAVVDLAITTLWVVTGILATASFALCCWSRWAAIVAFPLTTMWLFILLSDIHSEYIGPAIFRGISTRHVDQTTLAANAPLLFGVLGFVWKRRSNHLTRRCS